MSRHFSVIESHNSPLGNKVIHLSCSFLFLVSFHHLLCDFFFFLNTETFCFVLFVFNFGSDRKRRRCWGWRLLCSAFFLEPWLTARRQNVPVSHRNLVADDFESVRQVWPFCMSVLPAGKNECPIDIYFTIDTSETIALQESPPGSLVESIKVLCLSTISWLRNLNRKFLVVVSAKQNVKRCSLFVVSDHCRNSPDSLFSVWMMWNTGVLWGSTGTSVDFTSPKSKECLVVLDPRVISLLWASIQSYSNESLEIVKCLSSELGAGGLMRTGSVNWFLSHFSTLSSSVFAGSQRNPILGQRHLHRLRPHEHDPGNAALALLPRRPPLRCGHHRRSRDWKPMRGHQSVRREGARRGHPDICRGGIQEHRWDGNEGDRQLSRDGLQEGLHGGGPERGQTHHTDPDHRPHHQDDGKTQAQTDSRM